ncbi:hypothetical protein FACS1894127_0500 [Clostridia bacterium]|nr:hypothetical protein FACS1894127_0500 [Clostridia bacterium]
MYGLGGIGKSSLLYNYCKDNTCNYYDLRNAPSYKEVANWILSNVLMNNTIAPNSDNDFALTESIRQQICSQYQDIVLIFDNLESIMETGDGCGKIKSEFSGFDSLFQLFITNQTSSSLVLSGRERIELNFNRNDEIVYIKLSGLDGSQTKNLLISFSLSGDFNELSRKYSGNPLALKMAASTIVDNYSGNIDSFLASSELPSSVYELFQEHFSRLDRNEIIILLWLAVVRGLCSRSEIQSKIVMAILSKNRVNSAIKNLEKRCLIENIAASTASPNLYYLQGVILEFLTDCIIESNTKPPSEMGRIE